MSRAVAGFSKFADEFAIGVKTLHAVVQRIGDVEVSVPIHSHVGRQRKVPRAGQRVFLAPGADFPEELVTVRVEHQHLVLLGIHHVHKAVHRIQRDSRR